MTENDLLWKWRPSETLTDLVGATLAFLTISDAKVVLNSPMWCSSITELRMRALGLKTDRLFSVFVEEEDLIFGCRKKIIQTLEEADIENGCSLVGVVVNCAPSLIGDDIEEICTGAAGTLPVAIVEAGGFCGDFDNGFSHALATIIGTFSPKKLPVAWKTVNLIGFCPIDYCALGTLQEMKRLLMECGISVNVTLGALGNSANSIAQIGSAALNIVINRARGLRSAEWLKENLGQPFIEAPIPYGIKNTIEWVSVIENCFKEGAPVTLSREACFLQEAIVTRKVKMATGRKHIKRCIIAASYDTYISLANAVYNEWEDLELYGRCFEGNVFAPQKTWSRWTELPELGEEEIQLFIGDESHLWELEQVEKTIFIPLGILFDHLYLKEITFAGFTGWNYFMERIFTQYRLLCM